MSHFLVDCQGPDIPKLVVYQSDGTWGSPEQIMTLEDNAKLREEAANMSLAQVRVVKEHSY